MWSRTARLFLVGEKHGKNKVQFIREGHIRVQPNSRLVILGGCTLFANEPFTNQWCTRSIHLGNVSLFKTIELTKPKGKKKEVRKTLFLREGGWGRIKKERTPSREAKADQAVPRSAAPALVELVLVFYFSW